MATGGTGARGRRPKGQDSMPQGNVGARRWRLGVAAAVLTLLAGCGSHVSTQGASRALHHAAFSPNFLYNPPPQSSGPPPDLAEVAFSSVRTGYGVAQDGGLFETANAGATWSETATFPGVLWQQVLAADGSVFAFGLQGCTQGQNCKGPAALGIRAAGGTWRLVTPRGVPKEDDFAWLSERLDFVSSQVAYATIDPDMAGGGNPGTLMHSLLVTRDGGLRWQSLPLPPGMLAAGGISFVSAETGYLTASENAGYVILRTTDGGATWTTLYRTPVPLYALQFLTPQAGFAAGGHSVKFGQAPRQLLLATQDGGARWQAVYTATTGDEELAGLHFASPSTGWVTTGVCTMGANMPCRGPLLYTADGGKSFATVTGDPAVRPSIVGEDAWYLTGNDFPDTQAVLHQSTDGGRNWQTFFSSAAVYVRWLQYVDPRTGFAATNLGYYRTGDGGRTWQPLTLGAPAGPGDQVVFSSSTTAYDFWQGTLLRSRDSGRTWTPVRLPLMPQALQTANGAYLSFADPEIGYLLLVEGTGPSPLLKTRDGGRSWQIVSDLSGVLMGTMSLGFQGSRAAVVGGPSTDAVRISESGGRTWRTEVLGGSPILTSVGLAGDGIWVGGQIAAEHPGSFDGLLARSQDGGHHFSEVRLHNLWPREIAWLSPRRGFLVVEKGPDPGAVFVTDDGGLRWRQIWLRIPD